MIKDMIKNMAKKHLSKISKHAVKRVVKQDVHKIVVHDSKKSHKKYGLRLPVSSRGMSKHTKMKRHRHHHLTYQVVGLLALLGLLLLAYFIIFPEKITPPSETIILATVNGQNISADDVRMRWYATPERVKQQMDDTRLANHLLNQTIFETVLIQESEKHGIIITDAEVDMMISKVLKSDNMSMNQLQDQLKTQGLELPFLREYYSRQLRMLKLFDLWSNGINLTNDSMKLFYDANKNIFSNGNTESSSFENSRSDVRKYLMQIMLQQKARSLMESANITIY